MVFSHPRSFSDREEEHTNMRARSSFTPGGQQPVYHQLDHQQQQQPYPSYAPYVSDEDRVLALLSSSSSDNLRSLDHSGNMMANGHRHVSGTTELDWYSSPYYDQHREKSYLDQAREVDLDVYTDGLMDDQNTHGAASWKTWADINGNKRRDTFDEEFKPAAAFQPFAEEEIVMEDEYAYGDDEYDGQRELRKSNLVEEQQQHLSGNEMYYAQHPSYHQQQPQHGDFYESDRQYMKASQHAAHPFGAVGSETMRFDPVVGQTQEYINAVDQRFAHGQSGYEGYYAQERAQYLQQQAQAPPSVAQDEAAGTSGVALSGWLAHAVWDLCMNPFEPIVRLGEEKQETGTVSPASYGSECVDKTGQMTARSVLTQLYPDYSAYGYSTGSAHQSPYDPLYSGVSSPDLVSLRELRDPYVGSPVSGHSSPAMLCHNPYGLMANPSQAFVEFVHRTLSQTLLSPTAVVLALWYIRRLAIHSGGGADGIMLRAILSSAVSHPNGCGGEEAAQRVLTLGLACSNKWLDDNTFTNKSWSDVTLLSLPEINRLELYALGPIKFDLSLSTAEWDNWLQTIEHGLTPFVADGLAVRAAVVAMRQALHVSSLRFEEDIVSRREAPFTGAAQMGYDYRSSGINSEQVVLPPLNTVVDMRRIASNSRPAQPVHGSSALGFGSHAYGLSGEAEHVPRRKAMPPSAASLPPPIMNAGQQFGVYDASYQASREQSRRSRNNAGYRSNQSNESGSYPYQGHQYYLSHLASAHQPRLMSVMA